MVMEADPIAGKHSDGGAKNLRQRSGYHHRRRIDLATYNARTLLEDKSMIVLEEELSKLRWDILGLSEVRRQGEDSIILKSGNLFYFREGDKQSQGGVGFMVHKSLVNNILKIESVSSRVIYLILRISERYLLKVVQVYAPTEMYPIEEVETMYEDISRAIHSSKTHFNVVMGDFNAKLGKRNGDELRVGNFGYGNRNDRGCLLASFMEKEDLFMMNSFFRKREHRKWTWLHPNGKTKNEIDFIMSTKKHIFNDVSVINSLKTGNDHRMVRGTLNLNLRLERSRLMKSTLRPLPIQIQNSENFQLELHKRFDCLECDVDEYNEGFVKAVHTIGSRYFKTKPSTRIKKLSDHTLKLMKDRREMVLQSSNDATEYRRLNRQISKSLKHDLRLFNTARIKETIEKNRGSKVFARDLSLGQSQLTKLETEDGRIVSTRPEIFREIEKLYGELYKSTQTTGVCGLQEGL